MAYEAINQEDEQQKQLGFGAQTPQTVNQTTQSENMPVLGGQKSSELVQGVSGQSTQAQTGGQTIGGQKSSGMGARLSNLKKYIEANRNSGMAQGIQKGIEDIRTGVQKNIGESESKLKTDVAGEKARLSKGEELIKASNEGGGGVLERGRSEVYTQDVSQQPVDNTQLPDYSAYGKTASERLAEFNKYRTGEASQYDIENKLNLEQQAKELQKRADLSQSEAGRYQLLRETFNRPAYTTGQQRLDQLLLQARPEESQALATMAKTINAPVQEQLSQLQSLKESENKAIQDQAKLLSEKVGTGLTSAESEFTKSLEQARLDAATKIGQDYSTVQAKIQKGEPLTQDDLAKLQRGEDRNLQDFLQYYQKGVNPTIKETISSGKNLSDAQIAQIAPTLGMDVSTFKAVQSEQPITKEQFAINRGLHYQNGILGNIVANTTGTGPKTLFVPDEAATNEYNQYVSDIAANKTALTNLINQSLEVNPALNDYREAQALDYSQYLSALTPEDIAVGKVATAEDYARQAALETLAAQSFGPLQSADIGQAGTIGNLGVGKFDLEKALSMAREYYNPATTTPMARVSVPKTDDYKYAQGIGDTITGATNTLDQALKGNLINASDNNMQTGISAAYVLSGTNFAADAEKLLTGGENISKTYNSIKNVANKITSSLGTFWCSQVYNNSLVTKKEMKELKKFLFRIIPTHSRFLSWYIDNGQRIADLANQKGFDWNEGKVLLFDELLTYYKSGRINSAVKCYEEFTIKICDFVGEIPPYNCRKSGFIDSLKFLPKVLKFYWSK